MFATQAGAAEAEAESGRTLDELVVTADRGFGAQTVQVGAFRNARVIDTPLTVNVISREVIEAQAALTLHDALRNTAGVTRSQLNGATYDNISIRGILVENRGNYRLNGALPIINLVDLPLENKARVEVLKGASALYYGFVPPSGVINMTTKRAEADPLTVLSVRGDDHGSLIGALDVSRRFLDGQVGVRANFAYGEVEPGIRRVQGERALAAVALDLEPTDRLTVRLDYEFISKDISEPPAIALLPAVGGVIRLPEIPDPKLNLGDKWQRYDAFAKNTLLSVDYELTPRWAVRLDLGQALTERDRYFSQFQNYSLTTGEGTLQISLTRDQRFVNRNVRTELTGLVDTGPIEHELTFGFTANQRTSRGYVGPNRTVAQNLFTPRAVAQPNFGTPTPALATKITDIGYYVMDRMQWGPLQVIAGLRLSDYESINIPAPNLSNPALTLAPTVYTADDTVPALSVVYKPLPNVSLYATYLEGLEEGGVAPLTGVVNPQELLPPATSTQWEAGAKAEFGDSVVASIAYFEIVRPSAFINSQNRFVLDGETEYRGVEFMAAGELTESLSLIASGQWMDASLERASDPLVIGRTPENTAEWTGSLFADYRIAQVEGLSVNAGVFYVGERPVNTRNQAFVDAYVTLSLGARYEREIAGGLTSFQVNVENALDEAYWNSAGNNLLGVGAPRTVKFTVSRAL
ncbi:TonB-dependent siderophore receptor [Phenylobacterium sp.]|uniref:TonB-dependent siderophore receptor n=1 Tax=Phenylobacterium sp. TaxID=1871053 RepID=UPI002F938F62